MKNKTNPKIKSLSAITIAVKDMRRSLHFYMSLGLELNFGGEDSSFSSLKIHQGILNLIQDSTRKGAWWGRIIFYVNDVDAMYEKVIEMGLSPSTKPQDADWGERYFHIKDPDGHDLSLACPLQTAK